MRLICITGMHRSGTSAVARIVNLLGVGLGREEDLLPPAPDNPTGFWEHRGIKRINDLVLEHLGGTWQDLPDFPPGWQDDPGLDDLRERASKAVAKLAPDDDMAVVGVKDPRIALLIDFWRQIHPMDTVVALRHPVEVTASLRQRNEMSSARAAALWLAYTTRAIAALDDPVLVTYSDVLADPVDVGQRLAERLGLPVPDERVRHELEDFIDPRLRHHEQATPRPTDESLQLALDLYDALRKGEELPLEPVMAYLATGTPRVIAFPRTHASLVETQTERDELRRGLQRARQDLRQANDRIESVNARIEEAERELDQTQVERANVGRELEDARRQLQAAQRDLSRLRGRRSVRLALKAAEQTRPVFRAVRAARRRLGHGATGSALPWPTGDAGSVAPPAWRYDRAPVPGTSIAALAEAHPTIVVPIHNAPREVAACVESVIRNTSMPASLLLIDDASTDPGVSEVLARYDDLDGVRTVRNETNLGFTGSVNRGMAESPGDVVLLNSDTRVTPRWLERLVMAAHASERTASATPFSDNAGAFSSPVIGQPNVVPTHLTDDAAGRLVATASRRLRPETPTGNGFCMYIRRDALDDVGLFDADAFPRGYGEENDWSMRALERGWHHVVADDVYIYHEREASFGTEKASLAEAGRRVVDERHPGYTGRVRAFVNSPGLARAQEAVARAFQDDGERVTLPRTLFVIHHGGGGATSTNLDLLRVLPPGRERYVLSSDIHRLRLLRVHAGGEELLDELQLDSPLRFWDESDPRYRAFAASALVGCAIELIHVRHLIKHTLDVPRLAHELHIPVIYSFHDFYMSCPSVHLLDEQDRFCGGVCTPGDGACRIPMPWISEAAPHLKHDGVHQWRDRLRPYLTGAAALVTTSDTARDIYLRSYPELDEERFHVIEHGRDLDQSHAAEAPVPGGRVKILLPGNLDVHKGKHVVEELARIDGGRRLEFHFLGRSPKDLASIGTLHGPYRREDFAERVAEIGPAFIGLFSICAETYSHALSEAWAAGVPCLVSPLGALGERVSRHGGGWIVDIDDLPTAYEQILAIADDADEYEKQRQRALTDSLRSTLEMAADYEDLYRRAVSSSRRIRPQQRPAELALFVVGGVGPHHPGTVHVRSLLRLQHPDLAHEVTARTADPRAFIEGRLSPDLVLVQRTALDPDDVDAFLERCRATKTPLVFEIDDNLLDPEHLPADQQHWRRSVEAMRRLAHAAALVTVSTEGLAEIVRGLNPNVALVPNHLDERLWFGPVAGVAPRRPDTDECRLLYMGTRTHANDLALLRPALEQIQSITELNVVLEVIGGEPVGRGQQWYRRIDVPDGRATYPEFVGWLRSLRHRWDIAVAPLDASPFNAHKSDLKHLEYTALGLAGVYSDVGPYASGVEDGATGLLVDNTPEAWARGILRLLEDDELRRRIADASSAYVTTRRTLGANSLAYVRLLRDVLESGGSRGLSGAKASAG